MGLAQNAARQLMAPTTPVGALLLFVRARLPPGGRGVFSSKSTEESARRHRESVKQHILATLEEGEGCVFCRSERQQVQSFFRWFLIEKYYELPMLDALDRSRGFCPRHTRVLLSMAPPSTIVSVYKYLAERALVDLYGHGRDAPEDFHTTADRLTATAPCPACASSHWAGAYLLHAVQPLLADDELAGALIRQQGICIPHFLNLAPILLREELTACLNLILAVVGRGQRPQQVWGEPPEDAGVSWPQWQAIWQEAPAPADAAALRGEIAVPPVRTMAALLAEPGCPICRRQQRLCQEYLVWLDAEVRRVP